MQLEVALCDHREHAAFAQARRGLGLSHLVRVHPLGLEAAGQRVEAETAFLSFVFPVVTWVNVLRRAEEEKRPSNALRLIRGL